MAVVTAGSALAQQGQQQGRQQPQAGQQQQQRQEDEGMRASMGRGQNQQQMKMDIAERLDTLTNDLLSGDPLSAVTDYLTERDAERITADTAQGDPLGDAANNFKNKWRAKYGSDFNTQIFTKKVATAFNITPGGSPNQTSIEIPASHNLPPAKLQLVKEGALMDSWQIDVPDTVDTATLEGSIRGQYAKLDQASLPDNIDDAQLMVAHHLLLPFANPQTQGQGQQ